MNQRGDREGTFVQKRVGLTRASRWIAYMLVIGGALLALVWFVFVSGYWSVTELRIEGIRELGRGEVEQATYDVLDHGTWIPWDRRNILFADTSRLAEQLQQDLIAESVIVDKVYPNVLRLIVVERQRRVIVGVENRFLNVDAHGILTGDEPESSLPSIHDRLAGKSFADASLPPLLLIGSVETASSGEPFADPDVVRRWIEAYHKLIAAGFRYKTISLDHVTSNTMKIDAEGNFDVLMDLETPLEPQIETFRRFMQTKPKGTAFSYVDVRIPGKIFFK